MTGNSGSCGSLVRFLHAGQHRAIARPAPGYGSTALCGTAVLRGLGPGRGIRRKSGGTGGNAIARPVRCRAAHPGICGGLAAAGSRRRGERRAYRSGLLPCHTGNGRIGLSGSAACPGSGTRSSAHGHQRRTGIDDHTVGGRLGSGTAFTDGLAASLPLGRRHQIGYGCRICKACPGHAQLPWLHQGVPVKASTTVPHPGLVQVGPAIRQRWRRRRRQVNSFRSRGRCDRKHEGGAQAQKSRSHGYGP